MNSTINALQNNDISSSINTIFIIAVMCIFSILISNVGDKLGNWEIISTMCDKIEPGKTKCNGFDCDGSREWNKYDNCNEIQSKAEKEFHKNKLNFIIVTGTMGLIAGIIMNSNQMSKYNVKSPGVGISLGSLVSLMYFITLNWYNISNNAKISILSISLCSMIYSSSKLLRLY